MAQINRKQLSLLGLNVQGDIGPLTCWKRPNGRAVFYVSAPPKEPPSPLQKYMRTRWTTIADLWQRITPDQKANWSTAARACRLRVTGYGLFIFHHCHRDYYYLATIEARSGITLTPK